MNLHPQLNCQPIGYLRCVKQHKYEAPPQPSLTHQQTTGLIVVEPNRNFEVALRDLEGFSRIWLIWWFHRNSNWKPTTLPPRGRTHRLGTFATRSPYRPNPIAISSVPLIKIDGLTLVIGEHDLLQDTPILDIKPYIPQFDAFPEEKCGWLDQLETEPQETYQIQYGSVVQGLENDPEIEALLKRVKTLLADDPWPHRTRRIIAFQDGFRLSLGPWRVFYEITQNVVYLKNLKKIP